MFLLSGQRGRDAMKPDRKIGGGGSVHSYRHPLIASFNSCLRCLESLVDERSRRWTPLAAGLAAVLMALDSAEVMFVRFSSARVALGVDYSLKRLGRSYNGLVKALVRQADTVLPVLKNDLRRQSRLAWGPIPKTFGWILLAADGSKEELPRTEDQEKTFGIADNGQCPQALLTVIVEVHTGLLWDWRIDRGDGSEKHHLQEMVQTLPANAPTLLLADGYFVGYPLWSALQRARQAFLIRVGGNVHLLTKLFPDAVIERRGDIVYAWPQTMHRKCPPLRLRLIRLGDPGKSIWLLTNVLHTKRLSKKAAGRIYRLRWGVELFYRTFKRTMNLVKLRSRSGMRGKVELEWALIACWVMCLTGLDALHRRHHDPCRISPAGLIHVLRKALRQPSDKYTASSIERFRRQLALARRDDYRRRAPKHSRHHPKTKNTPQNQLQPPKLRPATPAEQKKAQLFATKLAA